MLKLNKFEKLDFILAGLIGLVILLFIFNTSHLIGFVRDEGFYMRAASLKADWFESIEESFLKGNFIEPFRKENIDKYFRYNREHPTLMKNLFGFSQYLLYRKLGWLSFAGSARFVAALFAMLTAMMIYLFGLMFFNRFTAVTSSLMFFMMPHIFFHSHLVCFDVPILFFWTGTFVLYALYLNNRSLKLAVATAVFFGLGMAVKHNVFFIPVTIAPLWFVMHIIKYRKDPESAGIKGFFKSIPIVFWLFIFVSIPVYFLQWPWIWYDTVDRFMWYFNFHARHVNYTNYYFGQELATAPFPISFPWGMTLFTTPVIHLIFFIAGIYFFVERTVKEKNWHSKEIYISLIIGSLFPIALISHPSVVIFGGIKHWFTGYPLMMTAGVFVVYRGLSILFDRFGRKKVLIINSAFFIVAAMALVPLNVKFSMRGAAFFNKLIGGAQGAAELRMQRNFWGYDILDLVPELNRVAPRGSVVYVMGGYEGLNWNSFQYLKREGIIREDIRGTNSLENADFAFFFYEKQNEHILNEIGMEFKTLRPLAVTETDSVFYSELFRREK